MASSWTLLCTAQPLKDPITYLGIHNGDVTQKLKIRRIGMINAQTSATSPTLAHLIEVHRWQATTTWTPGTAVSAIPHDTNNSALSNETTGYGDSAAPAGGTDDLIRQFWWDGDNPTGNGVAWYDWETVVPYGVIWDVGYGNSALDPLTLNEDEMVQVTGDGVNAFSENVDVWCEFTDEV